MLNSVVRLFFISLLSLPLFSVQAMAQGQSVAVVDINKILSESKAGKSIQKQLNERREAFQKEFSSREDKLAKAQKKLIEQQKENNTEEFNKKRKEFETQLTETRKLFQKRRQSLDLALNNALDELRKNVIQVTAEISNKKNYALVVKRNSVVIAQKELDITEDVLNSLNKKITKIKLNVKE